MSNPQQSANAINYNDTHQDPPKHQHQHLKHHTNPGTDTVNPKLSRFEGTPTAFNNFIGSLNNNILGLRDELDIKITGVNHQLEEMQRQERQPPGASNFLLRCCCCSQACVQTCACCICIFSCILLMLFWWIILPVTYCCVKNKVQKIVKVVIDKDSYQKLGSFSNHSTHRFRKLSLTIQDNHINIHKLQCIRTFIQQTGVSQFIFMNEALPMDGDDNQWNNFTENIKTITNIPGLRYTYKWQQKIGQN